MFLECNPFPLSGPIGPWRYWVSDSGDNVTVSIQNKVKEMMKNLDRTESPLRWRYGFEEVQD